MGEVNEKLTVTVPDAAAEKGVEVKRNGTPVPKSLWGVSEPVDPGDPGVQYVLMPLRV